MGEGSLVDIRPLAVPREGKGCPEGGWLAPAGWYWKKKKKKKE